MFEGEIAGMKNFFRLHAIERGLEIWRLSAIKLGVAFVGDRAGADHVSVGRSGVGLGVEFRKRQSLARFGPLVARTGHGVDLIAAEPLVDVADEARLAVFAVVDHVDAENRSACAPLRPTALRRRSALPPWSNTLAPPDCTRSSRSDGPRQAAGMRGEDTVGAVFHGCIQSSVTFNPALHGRR